jgi:hypothetical protein
MTVPRLFAIALIFLMTTAAWFILGTSVVVRTGESDARLEKEVRQLWEERAFRSPRGGSGARHTSTGDPRP